MGGVRFIYVSFPYVRMKTIAVMVKAQEGSKRG